MRILVTNDDGIDSVGLHALARAMTAHGDVVVVAPDSEYSGASASLGPLHQMRPDIHKVHLDGVPEAWTVAGPPALCVMFSRMGAFGGGFDLVVSGINPGANVGRAVYHSGTVGAAVTARNGGVSGIAVSQAVPDGGIVGQADEQVLGDQKWATAAHVASVLTAAFTADLPREPVVCNLNVPNCEIDEIAGWRRCPVGNAPMRAMESVKLVPRPGHEEGYRVEMNWGEPVDSPPDSDVSAVTAGFVSVTWLGRLDGVDPGTVAAGPEKALDLSF